MSTSPCFIRFGMILSVATLCITAILTTGSSFAENTSETGALLSESGALRDPALERSARVEGFIKQARVTKKETDTLRTQVRDRRLKRIAHSEECRKQMRKENRDSLFPMTLNCLRGDLMFNLDILRKERTFVEKAAGVPDLVRQTALSAIDALSDAITAVIDGIDTGVYASAAELTEAKKNLMERYRSPYWTAMTQFRTERLQTWIAHLLVQADPILASVSEGSGALLKTFEACLMQEEKTLTAASAATDHASAEAGLAKAQTALAACVRAFLPAKKIEPPKEEAVSSSSAPTLPRRVLLHQRR
ncbi:hypothetical protein A2529_01520 [Candidatus Peribacteria bacterium RIFOXYD2_FULL_58_15]|nr:MAG: hypothetical protein A2529_01520 [Candidatus Peribacteria bacterium RIFOXYD2_FULL_58_15]